MKIKNQSKMGKPPSPRPIKQNPDMQGLQLVSKDKRNTKKGYYLNRKLLAPGYDRCATCNNSRGHTRTQEQACKWIFCYQAAWDREHWRHPIIILIN